ncbi:MAG: glycine cleavage system aminomethyltransferase GcvT [Deltaproteobacteria bacterium]|nr:glycine cleavage system aminomethyltransferase GcvT [Deltaproteobacteria bacterium]
MNQQLQKTVLNEKHRALGAKMVPFAGWDMPVQYPAGIVEEHLATRREAGLFDVSHMGRFVVRGDGALPFLQHVLTNNAAALGIGDIGAQYTMIPTPTGGAVDDAYLYRFEEDAYLLVVNAANREKDWTHLQSLLKRFDGAEMLDRTDQTAMMALQGPNSRDLLARIADGGRLPEPVRNAVGSLTVEGNEVMVARTGYTGEPLCFELFVDRDKAPPLWDRILAAGAAPVGLGARDTLRLEAGLPLYGHELGEDADGREIPLMASRPSRFAVSFSPLKGDFMGRTALESQFDALSRIMARDYSLRQDLPRLIQPVAVTGRGIARQGSRVLCRGRDAGYVTSGTMVPHWLFDGEGIGSRPTDQRGMRPVCLAYLDCDVLEDDPVSVVIRGKEVSGLVVPYHLRSEAPPYARPILANHEVS